MIFPELSQEEIKNLVKTKDFRDFFERSSKMIEKVVFRKLNNSYYKRLLIPEPWIY